jgi:hypothetical protein
MSLLKRALILAISVAILGFIVSNAAVLQWLAAQDPALDFVIWYGLLAVWLAAVHYALFSKMITVRLDAAILLFWFGLGTVFYWAASDVALRNAGLPSGSSVPAFLLASEDQLISEFFLWLGASPAIAVILTYVVVPAILVFVAILIAKRDGVNLVRGLFGGGN